jgi:hypothetical protein
MIRQIGFTKVTASPKYTCKVYTSLSLRCHVADKEIPARSIILPIFQRYLDSNKIVPENLDSTETNFIHTVQETLYVSDIAIPAFQYLEK